MVKTGTREKSGLEEYRSGIAGMEIRFFRGQKTKFEHEHHQLKEIARIVAKEFPDEPVYLLTNVLVANGELDCVVLTRHGPLILDMKAFSGTIHGTENGKWQVETKDGVHTLPNLFIQAKIHRQDFIDKMIMICRANFPHIGEINLKKIGSWAYFCKGSVYPPGQIDFRRVKWFRVVTAESLPEKLRFIDAGYTLRPEDMDAIVKDLHLQEYSFINEQGNNKAGNGQTQRSPRDDPAENPCRCRDNFRTGPHYSGDKPDGNRYGNRGRECRGIIIAVGLKRHAQECFKAVGFIGCTGIPQRTPVPERKKTIVF